jgi:fused signal recognition particle receptor
LAAKKKAKEDADAAERERSAAKKRADEEAAAEEKRLAAEMAALEAEKKRLIEEKKKADADAKAAAATVDKTPEPKAPEKIEEKPISRKEWLKRNKQKPQDKKEAAAEPEKGSDARVGDSGKKIKDEPLDDLLDELEVILLESDVAYTVVQDIILGVRDNLLNKKYKRQYSLEEIVEMAVKDSVRNVLKINEFNFDEWFEQQQKPVVIMFVGINGTGKTTTIAKIAKRLLDHEKSVVIAACDTFRAGAIEQLSIHADRLNVKIVKHQQDADPSAVAYDAIEHARSKRKDAVLLDTAGRMQTNNNLIDEMKKIARIAKPALKIFVGDALAGNDAIEQAKVFDKAIGIDAIVLTKIDTDAKGGAALSIAHTIGKPIAFVSNGQEYEDLLVFDSNWMLERLFEE